MYNNHVVSREVEIMSTAQLERLTLTKKVVDAPSPAHIPFKVPIMGGCDCNCPGCNGDPTWRHCHNRNRGCDL
jgi:hypothetical protein